MSVTILVTLSPVKELLVPIRLDANEFQSRSKCSGKNKTAPEPPSTGVLNRILLFLQSLAQPLY